MDKQTKKAKKLGEVLAFSRVGKDTFMKSKEGLLEIWDESEFNSLLKENADHGSQLEERINALDESETGMTKADATGEKLSSMRDMYIGDDWDDPIEVCEWLGFFEGAAIVHWALIKGFAQSENDDALEALAANAEQYHRDLLEKVVESIKASVQE